jgi:hypothetical protein
MKKTGEVVCPQCKNGKLWVRRNWKEENGRSIGLEGFVRCDSFYCSYKTDFVEGEWDVKLRKYNQDSLLTNNH